MSGPPPIGAKRAWARPTMAPSLAATARSAARSLLTVAAMPTSIGFDASTSPARLRPRTFKSRRPLRIALPGIIEPAGRGAAEVGAGPEQVEHFERQRLDLGVDLRARAVAAGDDRACPPAKLRLVGASAQPSPERVSTAAWLRTSGCALDPAASG